MRIIFQMDKVHNLFCINGIAAHIFDGWRWVGGGRLLAFPSICPYGFHMRGGSWPYRVGGVLLLTLALAGCSYAPQEWLGRHLSGIDWGGISRGRG